VKLGSVTAGAGRQCAPAAPIGRSYAAPHVALPHEECYRLGSLPHLRCYREEDV